MEAAEPDFDVTTGDELVDSLPDPSEVSRELKVAFWTVVVLTNGAILGLAVGVLLIGLLGWYQDGLVSIAIGLVLGGMAYRRYRLFMHNEPDQSA